MAKIAETLELRIVSPGQVIFEGTVWAVSSKNSLGNFDILPEHANFVTLVENQKIIVRMPDGEIKEFSYPLAVIHCSKNKVTVFTEILSPEKLFD